MCKFSNGERTMSICGRYHRWCNGDQGWFPGELPYHMLAIVHSGATMVAIMPG